MLRDGEICPFFYYYSILKNINMSNKIRLIEKKIDEMDDLLEQALLEIVSDIFKLYPKYEFFYNAMGIYFFTVKNSRENEDGYVHSGYNNWVEQHRSKRGFTRLHKFYEKYDEMFKVTGNPLKVDRNMNIERHW